MQKARVAEEVRSPVRRGRVREGARERGAGFVAVLFALLIGAALYFGYFQMQGAMNERAPAMTAIDGARVMACRTNRQTLERTVTAWLVNHPGERATLDGLRADGFGVPSCPDGGRYSLSGKRVVCSLHQ